MEAVISTTKRVFFFKEEELPDPDPQYSEGEVIEFYSQAFPELAAGYVKERSEVDGDLHLQIGFTVGEKA